MPAFGHNAVHSGIFMEYYTDVFFEEAKLLNIKTPEIVSPATDNIDEYIKIIKK